MELMEYILSHMVWVWIAVMALAAFVEAATPVLVSIWFSILRYIIRTMTIVSSSE